MDREKFPNYFLAVIVLYVIVFLVGLGYFIIPALSYASGYFDFYLIMALFLLPLVLLAAYELHPEVLEGKEGAMRIAITSLVIIDFMLAFYLAILLA